MPPAASALGSSGVLLGLKRRLEICARRLERVGARLGHGRWLVLPCGGSTSNRLAGRPALLPQQPLSRALGAPWRPQRAPAAASAPHSPPPPAAAGCSAPPQSAAPREARLPARMCSRVRPAGTAVPAWRSRSASRGLADRPGRTRASPAAPPVRRRQSPGTTSPSPCPRGRPGAAAADPWGCARRACCWPAGPSPRPTVSNGQTPQRVGFTGTCAAAGWL
jgi:hypothetical protein